MVIQHLSRMRECYSCGDNKTYRNRWYNAWYDEWICARCYTRYIMNPKHVPKYRARRITFRDPERIYLSYEPRIGVCNLCRAVKGSDCKLTAMHHESYDSNNPSLNTIEICHSCHAKITNHNRAMDNR